MTAAFGLALGGRVGPYIITDELGEGGMGVVYRATHALLHRPAAIKVLRPELGGNSLAVDRFLNEARATTAIRHPGIVEVYDFGHTETGRAYIAMELLEGQPLSARLERRGRMSVVEAVTIARRIAAPLAVAHAAGIVHRDLKPDNVFLTRDPEGSAVEHVKLLDFGIAKLASAVHRTTIGVVLGTPAYMAPEQCLGEPDCDHRVDLYALGCMLYELITGAPPYGRGGSMTALMGAHLNAPIPRLTLPEVDPQVSRLVMRLLAKSAKDRPANAQEVMHDIDQYLATTVFTPPGPRTTLRLAMVTAAGLALTLASIGAWYRGRRTPRVDVEELGERPRAIGSVVRVLLDAGTAMTVFDASVAVPAPAPPSKTATPTSAPTSVSTMAPTRPLPTIRPLGSDAVIVDIGSNSKDITAETPVNH